MFGLLNVNKPTGMTSRDVVNRVQRIIRPVKVGHAGTLDPLASGVLVLCLGPATRLIPYVQRMPKQYEAEFLFGRSSDTDDVEGDVQVLADPPVPTLAQIERTTRTFVGLIEQVPPIYSAVKVKGRRAYARARAGESVELQARQVRVDSLQTLAYSYPHWRFRLTCGSGTYVRSIGRDVAAACDTAAVMSALVRTAVGRFEQSQACRLEDVTVESLAGLLRSPIEAVKDLHVVRTTPGEQARLRQGQPIANLLDSAIPEAAAVDDSGQLLAILRPFNDGAAWRPALNFAVG